MLLPRCLPVLYPVVASHSNSRELCPNDRNLTDGMVRLIADRGGVIGVTYGSGFISTEYHKHEKVNRDRILIGLKNGTLSFSEADKISHEALSGLADAPLPLLVKQIKHLLNVGGEDCLCLGSDFDGVNSLPQTISGIQSLPKLAQEMERQNISARVIEKIAYKNAFRYFTDALTGTMS